jgi:hypothetical protein
MLASYHNTIRHHSPDLDVNFHRTENMKSPFAVKWLKIFLLIPEDLNSKIGPEAGYPKGGS